MEKWSKATEKLTREQAYPGAMMKSFDGKYGMMSARSESGITIVGVKIEKYMPVPTDEVVAKFSSIDEMIQAGWAID